MKNQLRKIFNAFFKKTSHFLYSSWEKGHISYFSQALQRKVDLPYFALRPAFTTRPFGLLLLNDGQDFPALQLEKTLKKLHQENALKPLLVVGLVAGDRMQEYGTARQADYAGRGAKAKAYTNFVLEELMPFLQERFAISPSAKDKAFAGFSLGGLSAIDIVWNHPKHFQQVGVFSGSLWWRSSPFDPQQPDADLIMHQQIAQGSKQAGLRFWLQAGTLDETSDRNNNGIIDAIDDTLQLLATLESIGYQKEDITYIEVEGGKHEPQTWAQVMPDFLLWSFGR